MADTDDNLFAAEVLKGITNGMVQGLQIRQQRDAANQQKLSEMRKLDLYEKQILAQEERTKRQERVQLAEQGLKLDDKGNVIQMSDDELPQIVRDKRKLAAQEVRHRENQIALDSLNIRLKEQELNKDVKTVFSSPEAKDFRVDQLNAANYATMAELAEKQYNTLISNPKRTKPQDYSSLQNVSVGLPFTDKRIGVPEVAKSQDVRAANAIKIAFTQAILRKESGAAINDQELYTTDQKFFPQPGESDEIVENKRLLRLQQIENLKSQAGGAYDLFNKVRLAPEQKKAAGQATVGQKDNQAKITVLESALAGEKDPIKRGRIQNAIKKLQGSM
jgi:hypothetical protein